MRNVASGALIFPPHYKKPSFFFCGWYLFLRSVSRPIYSNRSVPFPPCHLLLDNWMNQTQMLMDMHTDQGVCVCIDCTEALNSNHFLKMLPLSLLTSKAISEQRFRRYIQPKSCHGDLDSWGGDKAIPSWGGGGYDEWQRGGWETWAGNAIAGGHDNVRTNTDGALWAVHYNMRLINVLYVCVCESVKGREKYPKEGQKSDLSDKHMPSNIVQSAVAARRSEIGFVILMLLSPPGIPVLTWTLKERNIISSDMWHLKSRATLHIKTAINIL